VVVAINNWFTANSPLFQFFYGQVFFIMGISILFQTRHNSRLNLARSLPWLAGFGILHGLYEWGDIFIPIQVAAHGMVFESVLDGIHLFVQALSFGSLFQFGIELMRPHSTNWRWRRFLPGIVFLVWLVVPFGAGFIFINNLEDWHSFANTISRYMLCVPACVFSSIGMVRQVKIQIRQMNLPQINKMLITSACALAFYGIVEGASVPKEPFFPASIINSDSFTALIILPPFVFRAMAGLVLFFALWRALKVFNIETERIIHQMEVGQVIATERERVARDLHDGALQQVYASGLMAQTLAKHVAKENTAEVNQLMQSIDQAVEKLRTFLSQDNPIMESVDLIGAIYPIIEEARKNIIIDTFWNTKKIPSLTPDQTRHFKAFISEAISNVIRHSKSSKAEIKLFCSKNHFHLQVKDYGQGIPASADPGFGLKNMRDRARLLGGSLKIDSTPNEGTTVDLDLPMEEIDAPHQTFSC
jgi:signal transduction histidine kinase